MDQSQDHSQTPPRSPLLLSRRDSGLLVIDVQQKLLPVIHQADRVVWNIRRLLDAACILQIPRLATEQYPRGLGPTAQSLQERLNQRPIVEKVVFSAGLCPPLTAQLREAGRPKLLVCGIEAHVCVLQTVLDLMCEGYDIFVAADATGSRSPSDCQWALRRMDSAGATITTCETAIFEWCERAGTDEFKQISALVREAQPENRL